MAKTDKEKEFLELREAKLKLANEFNLNRLRYKLEEIQLVIGYVEPGYDDEPFLLGNWNTFDNQTIHSHLMEEAKHWSEFVDQLNIWNWDLEWYDEWTICGECYKGMRTSPDNHWWKPYYVQTDDQIMCVDCHKRHEPEKAVESDEAAD